MVPAASKIILRPPEAIYEEDRRSQREFVGVFVQNGNLMVTFDYENHRPGPGSLRGHFEAARGHFFRLKTLFFEAVVLLEVQWE